MTTNEAEDNSIRAVMYQGKPLSQWEEEFKGEFTAEQLFKLIKSGLDIGRVKLGLVDENDFDNPVFKGETFFFNEKENDITESATSPEDVVTVGDLIALLRRNGKLEDKVLIRTYKDKKEAMLFDVNSKGGTTVIDIVAKASDGTLDEDAVNEGRSWHGGGYGGTGKSYRRLGSQAPRGAAIGWYNVEQLDPKAKGKMDGWRCGPSNFPFDDLFFPNRKYKVGTMVMRNKYVNAGPFSGVVYIAVPSYFDVINTKNEEGLKVLEALKIPLDLTFGMDPHDDYTMTYTEKA